MKRIFSLALLVSLLSFSLKEETYVIDKKACKVQWLVKKTPGQHEGDVYLQNGTILMNGKIPIVGEFILDMNSISVSDIADPNDNADLVNHLKRDDFFGTEKFPTAKLVIKKFEKIEKAESEMPNYNATADLTIKDITNEIKFPARIDANENLVNASANITIDRTKWNIVYKSKTIFSTLGDKFIYDDINFGVKLVLQQQR